MIKSQLKIDDSLIISRLEQKELSYIKPSMKQDSQFFLLMGKVSLRPFIDNLPIKVGLDLQVMGDRIIQCQIDTGYFHHDIENSLSYCSPAKAVLSLERLSPERPIFYQVALMLAFLELSGLSDDQKTLKRYGLALEFARVAHHLEVCHNVFSALMDIRLLSLNSLIKTTLDKPCQLCSRITQSPKSGLDWVRADHLLSKALALTEELHDEVLANDRLQLSLKRKTVINLAAAASLGLTGLFTRANRNNYDLRKSFRIDYQTASIPTFEGGDAWARFVLRLMDIQSSIKWLKKTISTREDDGPQLNAISIHDNFCTSEPVEKFAVGEVSGPEGDIRMSIFLSSVAEEKPIFRLRTPAYFIAQAIPEMLTGLYIHEMPIILHSLGIKAEEIDK